MTDEPVDTRPKTTVPPNDAEPDEDVTGLVIDGIMESYEHPENFVICPVAAGNLQVTVEELVAMNMASHGVVVFARAYVEALGRRAAEATPADLLKRLRVRRKRDRTEARFGVNDGDAATVVFSADIPDPEAALLALIDLDVMADELRGKTLRWNRTTSAWRPADES